MKRTLLLFPVMFMMVLAVAWGQTPFTATYDFTNVTSTTGITDPTAVPIATGVTFGSFTAVGVSANSNASSRFSFTGWSTGAINGSDVFSGSINTSQYYEVTITAQAGYSVDINSITFILQRSGTGIRQYSVRSALDSYVSNLIASISPANADLSVVTGDIFQVSDGTTSAETGSTITLSSSFDNITTSVTFRFYGWNAEAGTGTFSIDNVEFSGSAIATGSPNIGVTASSLTGFSYIEGTGPSTSQSYDLSGSNLTGAPDNITVTGSTNYEVSTNNVSFFSSVNVPYASATLSVTPVYVRLKSSLAAGSYNSETISNAGGGATTQNVTASGAVYKVEPTNHATSFVSAVGTPAHSTINLSWADATGGTAPDGYLIKGSIISFAAIADPVDGTAESNSPLVRNVAAAVQAATFTALTPNTTYFFKIYPYTNSSTNINYKTDGTIPATSQTTSAAPPASLLLEENFDYPTGTLLTNSGWAAHSSSGSEAITVNNGGLTFSDYASIAGNAALVDNTGEDVNRTFTEITTGTVYVSFLVKVDTIADGYFLNIGPSSIGTTFRGRVFIKESSSNLQFGLSKGSNTGTYSTNNYSIFTTYLLVLKYQVITGADNDEVSLFVFGNLDDYSSEPVTPAVGPLTDASISDINPGSVALRQYNATQGIIVDGIRVSEIWSFAPLPVELTSFTAIAKGKTVELLWQTATEVNNFGFKVQRSKVNNQKSDWTTIGFVAGNGTTNSPKGYSFVDATASGRVVYRLKQIDNDGKFEYSQEVEVMISQIPQKFALMQNYPNPFNPTTEIRYQMPEVGLVSLKVFDMLGREVATLVNEIKEVGEYSAKFDATQYTSGIYFYTLRNRQTDGGQANNFSATKKMLLVK